jgi:membrane protein YqaA with SNARE-associated domain
MRYQKLLNKELFLIWLVKKANNRRFILTIGILSSIDYVALFYPTQTTLILSSMLNPKKWRWITFWFAIGGTLGATMLVWVIQTFGAQMIELFFTYSTLSEGWKQFEGYIQSYGLWALLAIASIPTPARTAVVICAVAGLALFEIALSLFAGRMFAFGYTSYFAGRAPWVLKKVPGLKKFFERIETIQNQHWKGDATCNTPGKAC